MAQAGHYAEFCMRNSGKMAPPLFLIGADGPLMFVPTSLADENEKDAFATATRLMCIAHAGPSGKCSAQMVASPERIPECPVCQGPMKLRTAKKAAATTRSFGAVPNFPLAATRTTASLPALKLFPLGQPMSNPHV